ncbi:hypothetical protein J7U02_02685, partial [Lactobacillus delbrueckii subsp. lactis]|nr:hypothetical protein [Lactobacillus delbrueckii subsp. lactis]
DICKATKNSHFIWFARLLYRHLRGIYTFAKYGISTGKLEGINLNFPLTKVGLYLENSIV